MAHVVQDKSKLLARIGRIKGQLAAVERALHEETECAAILQTIAAMRGAMNGLGMEHPSFFLRNDPRIM